MIYTVYSIKSKLAAQPGLLRFHINQMLKYKISSKMHRPLAIGTTIAFAAFLQGCAMRPLHDDGLLKLVDGNVVRMTVDWEEPARGALMPASYNVEAKYFKWTPEANQYRWVLGEASLRRDKWGKISRRILVPDEIPRLKSGDLIDVYLGEYDRTNYGELRAPVVLRLVCTQADKLCQKRASEELGGKNEVLSHGRPPMDNLTFTKKFDLEGKPLASSVR